MIGLGIGVPLSRSLAGGSGTGPARPAAYRVVYEESLNGSPARWEVLSVRRPFESADLVYITAGPPSPSDRPTSGSVSTEQRLYDVDASGLHDVGGRQPGPPSGDQDLAGQLPEMLHRGLASDRGSDRRVAGRSCHVYRFLEPPVGPVRHLGGPTEHDELCIDAAGLVLSETWTLDGRVVTQRSATSVSLAAVAIPPVSGASPTAGNASLVSPATDQRSFLAPPAPVPGYHAVPPVRFTLPDPLHPSSLTAASVVWTFVKGADVVTVEAGNERPGQLPWQPDDTVTEPVSLAGLGPARSAIRSDGSEIRVDLEGGSWVRVRGTMPASALADYANGLRLAAR